MRALLRRTLKPEMFTYEFCLFVRHMFYSLFTKREHVPFTLVRFLFILFALFGQIFFQLTARVSFLLESFVFFRYQKQYVKKPLFIVGNFRSGSTYLQNVLTADSDTFSCMNSGEIYIAPSYLQRVFYTVLGKVDTLFGSPLKKLVTIFENKTLKKVKIHRMGFFEPEEDEGLFAYTYNSVLVWFMFPFMDDILPAHKFDTELSHKKRKAHMNFYKICVWRHMAFHNKARFFLSKSPSNSPKVASLVETFPDARFIYLVRSPYEVIPSIMNWFSLAWGFFVEKGKRYPFKDYVIEMAKHWYSYPLEYLESLPENQYYILKYDDFVQEPKESIKAIYKRFGIEMNSDYEEKLSKLVKKEKKYKSTNIHSLEQDGFTPEYILQEFEEIFDRFGFDKTYQKG